MTIELNSLTPVNRWNSIIKLLLGASYETRSGSQIRCFFHRFELFANRYIKTQIWMLMEFCNWLLKLSSTIILVAAFTGRGSLLTLGVVANQVQRLDFFLAAFGSHKFSITSENPSIPKPSEKSVISAY